VRCCWSAAWLLSLAAFICSESFASPQSATAAVPALDVQLLSPATPDATVGSVTRGALDSRFTPLAGYRASAPAETLWLRLTLPDSFNPASIAATGVGVSMGGVPVLIARGGWFERIEVFQGGPAAGQPLPHATELREFGGAHESVFILPKGTAAGQPLYLRVATEGDGADSLRFSLGALDTTLAQAAEHSRMIALAFGALTAMALGSLLIWLILKDKLFLLYPGIFFLQAVYLAYFSGEAFDWPLLSYGKLISAFTWNVPVALSGAVACLFIREVADLERSSPQVYKIFGWLAWVFVALTLSNLAHLVGLGGVVAAIGNLVFVGSAVFTLVVAFLAWRRGNRAAGWFLIAWGMLETVAIATGVRLLLDRAEHAEVLLYYGLPLSMVAAAILVALGVADRLREQRAALTDAERRAQTDPLTGVLNRRSLIERLDAACLRARARGLPIALLFIDL
jgi:hypothetical protein